MDHRDQKGHAFQPHHLRHYPPLSINLIYPRRQQSDPRRQHSSGNTTETPQRRGIGTSASKSRAVQGIYVSSTHPQKRLGGRDTFNLSMAVRVSEAEVQAERMAHYGGGKHGVQVAQDRLSRAVAQATTSAKSRKYDDMAGPASDDAGNTTTK